ncbi:MAG TPA: chemotaxis protein CheW [Alphaproteobacteria bacterium]
MDDLLQEFLTEASENLAILDVELVKFEQDPNNAGILQNIFRLVHTVKGTCGFLGLSRLEAVAHAGENVLGKFRDGELTVTPLAVTLILRCLDGIRAILGTLEQTGQEPEGDDSALIAELNALAAGETAAACAAADATTGAEPDCTLAGHNDDQGPVLNEHGFPVAAELLAEVAQALAAQGIPNIDLGATEAAAEEAMLAMMMEAEQQRAPAPAPVPAHAPAHATEHAAPAPVGEVKESAVAAASIRVSVDILENLMTLVSELVLTRNQLLQMVRVREDSEFKTPLQRLSHITTELQEGVMKSRMQPIGNAWSKLPRIVRDLSIELDKKIELVMQGAETELDRQLLELIKDPLTHMVRNSVDHGLEATNKDRVLAGKSEVGKITLKAYHEGGHIIISIADDGRGLNAEKIRAKALANGLTTEAELETMSDHQLFQFIFRAGFSTADKVTSVSGRGVGMDVVRSNIEKIGGTIELRSAFGAGTTFTIKIPLTLAIVSALVVECAKQRFAIPQINVLELVRTSRNSEARIEEINRSPVLRLRDRLLPLVSLDRLLKIDDGTDIADEGRSIVIAQVGNTKFGMIVDRVFDTEEIVVKPVSTMMRGLPFYSGNTILGDGNVIMILDPHGVANSLGNAQLEETKAAEAAKLQQAQTTTSFLLFRAGGPEVKAIPLGLVTRIERIPAANVEHTQGRYVVQYRDHLMPLVPFGESQEWRTEETYSVLVFTERDRSVGLVVDTIVDIVEDGMDIALTANQPGLLGSSVIAGAATDVIDAGHFLTLGFQDWFGAAGQGEGSAPSDRREALLVDDSLFFRNLMTPYLSAAGWKVTTCKDAEEALRLREAGRHFAVIVSDIEMPGLGGMGFARDVKADPRWHETPFVALSALSTQGIVEQSYNAGCDHYVAKSNREELLRTMNKAVNDAVSSMEVRQSATPARQADVDAWRAA